VVDLSEHWGQRALDWAELAEPSNQPLYAEVLRRLEVGIGTRLLDVGCGSGYAASMAAHRGAEVTGIDITPELLEIARERVPAATFVQGGMDKLPFGPESFDVVVGFNSFQFADDPVGALAEGARVLRHGGRLAATTFAEPERNESTALHLALEPLRDRATGTGTDPGGAIEAATRGPTGTGQHLPYALSEPGGLERLIRAAGMEPCDAGEVALAWAHPDVDLAVRAVLASGGGAMAIAAAGEDAARAALEQAVRPFTLPDGGVRMNNVFRFVIAERAG
jgi:SAM-dependent methyltransferase